MNRYTLKLDEDRKTAGWGEWYWIVDTTVSDPIDQLVELLPATRAQKRCDEMNGKV